MIDDEDEDEDDLEEIISTLDVNNTNLALTVNPTSHIDPIVNLFDCQGISITGLCPAYPILW